MHLKHLTPIQFLENEKLYLKRDDLFSIAGVAGGKARTCYALAQSAKIGLCTAGSRSSPQVNIVANIAKHLNLKCVAHLPMGRLNEEIILAQKAGCEIVQHRAGYNSVIIARSRDFAKENGYTDIPFGMECDEAVRQTMAQVENIPDGVKRIIVPVGSGMSLCGIMHGLVNFNKDIPVVGVIVGASPLKRIGRYAPAFRWQSMLNLVDAGCDYSKPIFCNIGGVTLDPIYEAKCYKFLQPGDLLWCVGIRQSCK